MAETLVESVQKPAAAKKVKKGGKRVRNNPGMSLEEVAEMRKTSRQRLSDLFEEHLSEDEREALRDHNLAKNAELGVHNSSIAYSLTKGYSPRWSNPLFVQIYRQIFNQVCMELDPTSTVRNPRLLRRLVVGEFLVHTVAFMQSHELCPERWNKHMERQEKREADLLDAQLSEVTNRFQCKLCKQRKTIYYSLQTRRADEPETQFIRCVNCNNRWKM
jgi:DNA-directed RNA polymerase subunit M/transcription elongation factor TFIIS